MNFCDQLRLLLWKMYIMKKRRPLCTLCELFLPVLLSTILLLVRDVVVETEQHMTYGISVPIFSVFDVDGLSVSLPGTIDSQNICFGQKINKYIGVTPNDDETRWFISHLAEYYDYVSAQSLFDYYDWNYVSSNEDNFRDLLILVNNTFDLCAQHYHDSDDDSCDSFLDLLNTLLIFSNITNSTLPGNYSSDIISPNGQWTPQFIENILADLAEESDWNNEMLMLSQMLSTPQKPPCLNALTDIFMFFDTQQEMEQYTQYSDYGDGKPAIAAGIVFNHISNESIDYTLRFNMSDIQSTKKPYINDHYRRSPLNLMNQSFDKYVNSGFLGWQNAIDQTFLRILNNGTAINLKIGIHIFPFPPNEFDFFWFAVEQLLLLFVVEISFTYSFFIITKTIVEEKLLRLKEGFRMLGGSNTAYLLSYMITQIIIFSISNCFLVWCLCANIFIQTNPLIMFVGIELFGLSMISLAMIVAMLFDQPLFAGVVASLTFLVLLGIPRFVAESPYESTKNVVCWSSPSAFVLALLQFIEYEAHNIGMHWSSINELNAMTHFRLSTAYIYMFVDFVIYTLLMFYLDRVWPTKYEVRRPFYAPFEIMDGWYDKIQWCRKKRGSVAGNMSKSLNMQDEVKDLESELFPVLGYAPKTLGYAPRE